MNYLRRVQVWFDSQFPYIVGGMLIITFVVKAFTFWAFPNPLGEDSTVYIWAMKFMDLGPNGDPALRDAYGYRQFFYPFLLLGLYKITDLPIYVLCWLQIFLTTFCSYFFYRVCLFFNCYKILVFFGLCFLAFYGRFLQYSYVVAPEPLIAFFISFIFFLMVSHWERIKKQEIGSIGHGVYFLFLALAAFIASSLKENFLPFAVLTYAAYLVYLIFLLSARSKRQMAIGWVGSVLAVVLLWTVSLAYSRDLLQTNRIRPMCFPWPIPLLCYYMDVDSPTHRDLKDSVASMVREKRQRLEDWEYSFGHGNEKVNRDCFESRIASDIFAYVNRSEDIREDHYYESMCAVEKVGGQLFLEGVQANFLHYLRYWVFPEIYRGLFSRDHIKIGEHFKSVTIRDFREDKWNLLGEFARKDIYKNLDTNEKSGIDFVSNPLFKGTLHYWILCVLAIVVGILVLPRWRSKWSSLLVGSLTSVAWALGGMAFLYVCFRMQTDDYYNLAKLAHFMSSKRPIDLFDLKGIYFRHLPYSYRNLSQLILILLPLWVLARGWRQWSLEKNILFGLILAQVLSAGALVVFMSWFYERYTNYVFWGILVLATVLLSELFRFLGKHQTYLRPWRQER